MSTALARNSDDGAMISPEASQIEVASGGFVDVWRPDPATLQLDDIAAGLSRTCRYGGQLRRDVDFYSVAEHAVLVYDLLRYQGCRGHHTLRWALFHDAAEAYLGDVVAPLKWALRRQTIDMNAHYHGPWPPDVGGCESAYDRLSDLMDRAIAERFDIRLDRALVKDVQVADMWALRIEAAALTTSGGASWRWPGELPDGGRLPRRVQWAGGLQPGDARELWLARVEG